MANDGATDAAGETDAASDGLTDAANDGVTDAAGETDGARGGPVALLLRIFAGALVALWVIDVIVNLGLLRGVVTGTTPYGGLRDYAGLLIAEIQIAAAVSVLAVLTALPGRLVRLTGDRGSLATATASALVATAALVGAMRNAWGFGLPVAVVVASVAGLVLWLALCVLVRRMNVGRSLGSAVSWILTPGLMLALLTDAAVAATRSAWGEAAVGGLAALLLAWFAIARPRRASSQAWRVLEWTPPAVAVLLVVSSCLATVRYGTADVSRVPETAESNAADVAGTSSEHPAVASSRPDIVLIVLDTLRADHLGSFGYDRDTMPALERWGGEARVYKRAVAPSGWTVPSHASMFSGLTVSSHGMHYSSGTGALRTQAVEGVRWLPEALRDEGYYCVAVAANPGSVPPDVTGFHRVLVPPRAGWANATLAARAGLRSPVLRGVGERLRWRMPYVDAEGIVRITKRSVPEGAPVFLFVNFLDPHSPYNPPDSALESVGASEPQRFGRYIGGCRLNNVWDSLPDGKRDYLVDLYDGELRWLDIHLEELLRWIDERFGEDTLVIVTSDHGEELGEEGRVGHEFGLSQRLIHVPLFIRCGDLAAGESHKLVTTRGLYPFVLASARGEAPDVGVLAAPDEHGLISERYISGRNVEELGEEYGRAWVSVIEGRRKVVGPGEYGLEVYDIASAGFSQDVSVSDTTAARALGGRIDAYWTENRDTRDASLDTMSDAEREQLRALGYIQ